MSRAEGFAAIPNWMIRDERVSLYALTVYGALASHSGPGGIHPSQALLAAEARCSERQVRTALRELEELGVVERVRRRGGEGRSTTLTNGYVLHPNGRLGVGEERVEEPARRAVSSELPAHSDEATGTGAQVVPYIEEEPIKKKPPIVPHGESGATSWAEDLFEVAWKHWPRNENKKKAREKFLRLKDQEAVAAAIVEHGDAHAKYSGPYVPHLITWLNGERWNDPLPGPRGQGSRSSVDIGRDVDAILRARAQGEQKAVGA